jgi:hypothetical protein
MARYRFLQSAYVDGALFNAGEIRDLRDDWTPGPFVEPLCAKAVAAFFEAGPWPPPLIRQQFSDILPALPSYLLEGDRR